MADDLLEPEDVSKLFIVHQAERICLIGVIPELPHQPLLAPGYLSGGRLLDRIPVDDVTLVFSLHKTSGAEDPPLARAQAPASFHMVNVNRGQAFHDTPTNRAGSPQGQGVSRPCAGRGEEDQPTDSALDPAARLTFDKETLREDVNEHWRQDGNGRACQNKVRSIGGAPAQDA